MEVVNWKDCEAKEVKRVPYKGRQEDVIDTTIRWLSKVGADRNGYPEYGLRHFTLLPGGRIPIHNHFYHQTMYILEGRFECWTFDAETDALVEQKVVGPGDAIFVPGMMPHGMQNIDDGPGAFLCCICSLYRKDAV